jgi:putative spermidine/putrescine transport system substrate-binding protein
VPVRLEACKGNSLLTDQGCERHGLNSFDKIHFWRTPVANCKSQDGKCVPYYRWVSDYIAVLGGR